ncbi:hypothetical protein [Brumimicrobium salinarum]|uniref:hypothetical protein n=1 Tax=Brumimicrobium salinarum TaxID=2058658 RepID=UPI00105684D5|nr:hypothetical protein [Brumimicrobium salinarum]
MKLFLAISFFVFSSFVGVLAQKNRNDDLKNEALDDIKALSSKDFPYIELFHQGVREKMAGNFEEAKTIFRKCLDQKKMMMLFILR